MNRQARQSGREPRLGGAQRAFTGREPALGRDFRPIYGPIRIPGLEAPPVPGRRRPIVALAECDDDTAELATLLGESNGYEIRRTDDGVEAWRLIRAVEPNLLVFNIRLPRMNGLELIQKVRQHPDNLISHLPILVMDVHHRHHDVMSAFNTGADDYLEKPYQDIRMLLRSWQRMLDGIRRPAPLTALLNEDVLIRQVALSCLLRLRPSGLETGLGELLWRPEPEVRAAVRWALNRLGTPEATHALQKRPNDLIFPTE